MIMGVPWHGDDGQPLLESLALPPIDQANRRKMQNYESMVDFYTAKDWAKLLDSSVSSETKKFIIFAARV